MLSAWPAQRRILSVLLVIGVTLAGLVVLSPSASAAGCIPLTEADLAYDSPRLTGTVTSDGVCYEIDQPAGTVVQLGIPPGGSVVPFDVVNAEGSPLCAVDTATSCTLTGTGPYRVEVRESWRYIDFGYRLHLFRVNNASGCTEAVTAPFGDPGAAPIEADLETNVADCRSLDLPAGQIMVNHADNGAADWTLYDSAGTPICSGTTVGTCDLPSAQPTVLVTVATSMTGAPSFASVLVPLGEGTPGCQAGLSTSWQEPKRPVSMQSSVQVDCLPLQATAGDRILVSAPGRSLVVDGAGRPACVTEAGRAGCVLDGSGTSYRLLTYLQDELSPAEYSTAARNLTTLDGCPTVAVSAFGTTPGDVHPGIGCRRLDIPNAGRFLVAAQSSTQGLNRSVYTPSGEKACPEGVAECELAAGEHVMVTSVLGATSTTSLHDLADPAGCTPGEDTASRVLIGDAAESRYDCYLLPTPSGATVTTVWPLGEPVAAIGYYDANGVRQCANVSNSLYPVACHLDGEAPFRAVARDDPYRGGYRASVVRIDEPACAGLPAGEYGTTDGAGVTMSGGAFAGCLAFPASSFGAKAIFAAARQSGTGDARLVVMTPANTNPGCVSGTGERVSVACSSLQAQAQSPATPTVTVLVVGRGESDTSYRVVRRPLGSASGCPSVGSTDVGDPATTGTIGSYLEMHCYSVAADPGDRFVMNLRTETSEGGLSVYRPDGNAVCLDRHAGQCEVAGSSEYQLVVRGRGFSPSVGDYDLEPWRVQSAAGFAEGCFEYDDYGSGFGPIEDTFTSTHTGRCIVVRDSGRNVYAIDRVNTAGGSGLPVLYPMAEADGSTSARCSHSTSAYECSGFESTVDGFWRQRGLLLLFRPDGAETLPFRLTATCLRSTNCGDIFRVTEATAEPASSGTTATVRITGGRLAWSSDVRLVRDGHSSVTGSPVSVADDQRSMVVDFDLTGVEEGAWGLEVVSSKYGSRVLTDVLTVTPPRLELVEAPVLPESIRVGERLRASAGSWSAEPDSVSYQWLRDGAPVAGADGPSFRVRPGHLNSEISLSVTARLPGHVDGTATTTAARVYPGLPPQNVEPPKIRGVKRVGNVVRATRGEWTLSPTSYSYRWYKDGRRIRKATSNKLRLRKRFVGVALHVRVTPHRRGYSSISEDSRRYIVRGARR